MTSLTEAVKERLTLKPDGIVLLYGESGDGRVGTWRCEETPVVRILGHQKPTTILPDHLAILREMGVEFQELPPERSWHIESNRFRFGCSGKSEQEVLGTFARLLVKLMDASKKR